MTRLATLLALSLALATGCSCNSGYADHIPVFPRVPMPWNERGEWGPPQGGVSPRTVLGFSESRDLPWIGLCLRGAKGGACVSESGCPPFNGGQGLQVLIDGEPVETVPSNPLIDGPLPATVEIEYDHVLVVGPVSLAQRPAAGKHQISIVYQVDSNDEQVKLTSPPLAFEVPAGK